MNPKTTILLSVFLTAFAVVILYGVTVQVANLKTQQDAQALASQPTDVPDTSTPTDSPTDVPSPTALPPLSYDEAASLAAAAINRQDVYSVETFSYQGVDSFKVVFSSGDIVYVGLNRQVLAAVAPTQVVQATTAPVVSVYVQPTPAKRRTKNGGGGGGSTSSSPPPSSGGEPGDN